MKATPRAAILVLPLLIGGVALAGCSSGDDSGSDSAASDSSVSGSRAGGDSGGRAFNAAEPAASATASGTSDDGVAAQAADTVPQQAAVISTGDVELRSGDVSQALFDVRQVVDRYQGSVQKESTDTDRKGRPIRSRLVVRVPSEHFETAMKDLGKTATLVSTSSNSKDVTTAVLDNNVRVQVEKRSINRISTLLDQATSIKDVIAIEGQLSQRQADLASLEQQQRYLADQTSMSTITVSVEHSAPTTRQEKQPDHTGFAAGLGAGWHALRGFVVGLLTVVGALIPWLLVALVLGVVAWPTRRLWRRHVRT